MKVNRIKGECKARGSLNDAIKWDVDFSLALFNRTGKFQIGRLFLEHAQEFLGDTLYWRIPFREPPSRLLARIIGKVEAIERQYLRRCKLAPPPRRRPHPVIHLDPLTALTGVSPRDIVLCHDVGPITHPDFFEKDVVNCYRRAFERIRKVRPFMVFVSKASRREFIECYGEGRLMKVIYPPIRRNLEEGPVRPLPGIEKPFLLTVGSIGDRKNQVTAIEAFRRSGLAAQGYEYVLCGASEPGYNKVVAAAAGCPGVRILSFVSDDQLRWLYRKASGFLLTSLLEGFGMPVAEAMQYGHAPIVSRNTVLEEVAGTTCFPVDPLNADEIAEAMKKAVNAGCLSKSVIAEQLGQFSEEAFVDAWRDTLISLHPNRFAKPAARKIDVLDAA